MAGVNRSILAFKFWLMNYNGNKYSVLWIYERKAR